MGVRAVIREINPRSIDTLCTTVRLRSSVLQLVDAGIILTSPPMFSLHGHPSSFPTRPVCTRCMRPNIVPLVAALQAMGGEGHDSRHLARSAELKYPQD